MVGYIAKGFKELIKRWRGEKIEKISSVFKESSKNLTMKMISWK